VLVLFVFNISGQEFSDSVLCRNPSHAQFYLANMYSLVRTYIHGNWS